MSKEYILKLSGLCASDAFKEAREDELRVLLALIESGGSIPDADMLANAIGLGRPRVSSALVFWSESGIITESQDTRVRITDEFEENLLLNDTPDEERSRDVAASIRNSGLETVIAECAQMMDKPALNTQEIKHVTALSTQLALSDEYILTLAAYLAESGKLTALRLSRKASDLVGKGIDTTEELERFIARATAENAMEREVRRELEIYDRALSKPEKKYFAYWTGELGYSPAIIGEAYDIAVSNTGKYSLAYMNTLLRSWHDAGCKTVPECRSKYELDRPKIAAKAKGASKKNNQSAETPRYADFDSEDALIRALERSYGKSSD